MKQTESAVTATDIYDRLKELVPELNGALARIEEERRQTIIAHQVKLGDLDAEKKRLTHLLRALGVESEKPQRRPRAKTEVRKRMSSAVLTRVVKDILSLDQERVTVVGLHESMEYPWTLPQTYIVVKHLREIEFLGKTGKDESNRVLFRILDREIGSRLLEEENV